MWLLGTSQLGAARAYRDSFRVYIGFLAFWGFKGFFGFRFVFRGVLVSRVFGGVCG